MWQPVPPTPNHVGMGMIATTDASEPALHAMRCVRRELVVRSARKPIKIWDNSGGAAGQKGSLWIINSLGLIAATSGYDEPKTEFFDFAE